MKAACLSVPVVAVVCIEVSRVSTSVIQAAAGAGYSV
jgi:hypothetical protein